MILKTYSRKKNRSFFFEIKKLQIVVKNITKTIYKIRFMLYDVNVK